MTSWCARLGCNAESVEELMQAGICSAFTTALKELLTQRGCLQARVQEFTMCRFNGGTEVTSGEKPSPVTNGSGMAEAI